MISTRWNPLGKSGKPYAYEVEYIESTGTQYIDTEVYSTSMVDELEATVENTWEETNGTQTMGCEHGRYFGCVNRVYQTITTVAISAGTKYKSYIKLSSSGNIERRVFLNNEELGVSTDKKTSGQTTLSFILFAMNNAKGNKELFSRSKLYTAIISVNGICRFDATPVVDHDGVACMYDKVTKKLFYNQGTGKFIAGPRV